MAKPRRKQPGLTSIEQSRQGRHLLALWSLLTGQKALDWTPLEALRDGTTVFLLAGPAGAALLLERKEKPAGSEWLHEYGLYYEDGESTTTWLASLEAYRWDPWLHAEETGDRSVVDASPAKRRALTDERSRETAAAKDSLRLSIVPAARVPESLVGVEAAELRKVLEKHGVRLGPAGALAVDPGEDDTPYTGRRSLLDELPTLADDPDD